MRGYTDALDFYLDNGADVNGDSSCFVPLIGASYMGQIDVVDRLLAAGANTGLVVTAPDYLFTPVGTSALSIAVTLLKVGNWLS